jgi:hypothetical protein
VEAIVADDGVRRRTATGGAGEPVEGAGARCQAQPELTLELAAPDAQTQAQRRHFDLKQRDRRERNSQAITLAERAQLGVALRTQMRELGLADSRYKRGFRGPIRCKPSNPRGRGVLGFSRWESEVVQQRLARIGRGRRGRRRVYGSDSSSSEDQPDSHSHRQGSRDYAHETHLSAGFLVDIEGRRTGQPPVTRTSGVS